MKKVAGFSLIELVVTLAVAGVALTVAIPGFKNMVANSRMTSEANMFVAAVNAAKMEAQKRRRTVTITPISGINDWSKGVTVTESTKAPPLNLRIALQGGSVEFKSSTGKAQYKIVYFPAGVRLDITGGDTLTICDNGRTGETGRQVSLNTVARVSVTSITCD